MSRPAGRLDDRFWSKVDAEGDCWIWTAAKTRAGYGTIHHSGRQMALAHRVSYELLVGPIPPGLQLDHLCRVRACVNPDHLEPVTQSLNNKRGAAGPMSRIRSARITHCPQGHPYVSPHLYITPEGKRACRTCRVESLRRTRARRQAERTVDVAHFEFTIKEIP